MAPLAFDSIFADRLALVMRVPMESPLRLLLLTPKALRHVLPQSKGCEWYQRWYIVAIYPPGREVSLQ